MGTALRQLMPLILMTAVLYFVLVIPQNKRKKQYKAMIESLKVNDEIVTRGGIFGKIVNLQDEYVIIQSGPDKTKLKLAKDGIMDKLNMDENEKKEETKKDDTKIGYKEIKGQDNN